MEVSLKELPVTVRGSVPEVVLSGFITRMLTVPGVAICGAVTFAVSWVADETVVESEAPFQRMVVPLTKFVPFAMRTKSALPAATEAGEREASVGGRTPLNPPHPHRNRDKTTKSRGRRIRDQLIECVYCISGETVPQPCLHCAGMPQVGRASFEILASYDDFLKGNSLSVFIRSLTWNDERTNAREQVFFLIYPNRVSRDIGVC
ncbi:MAG TPA: hypothetical protein VGG62_04540 [Terracidiphilus sp.]